MASRSSCPGFVEGTYLGRRVFGRKYWRATSEPWCGSPIFTQKASAIRGSRVSALEFRRSADRRGESDVFAVYSGPSIASVTFRSSCRTAAVTYRTISAASTGTFSNMPETLQHPTHPKRISPRCLLRYLVYEFPRRSTGWRRCRRGSPRPRSDFPFGDSDPRAVVGTIATERK